MRIAVFAVVVLAVFPAEALAASAISSGTEVVGVSTSIFFAGRRDRVLVRRRGRSSESVQVCLLHQERGQERSVLVLQLLRSEDLRRRRTAGADREVPGSRDSVW